MKVPSLEDMIQQIVEQVLQQQISGDCICEKCQKLLTEHVLILDPFSPGSELLVCCYPASTIQTFKPPKAGVNYEAFTNTLRAMLYEALPLKGSIIIGESIII